MEKRSIIASAIVLLAALAWFLFSRGNQNPASEAPAPAGGVVDNVAILTPKEVNESVQARQKEQLELKKRREEYIKEIRKGIGFYHMEESKNGLQVRVRFEPYAVCYAGDLNAIFHDYRQTSPNRIIITLESLDVKKKSPIAAQVSLENMKVGFEKVFTLPKNSSSDIMGIFICSDAKRTGRCVGKKNMDVNATLFASGKKTGSYTDKIYIFNLAIVTDKLIRFVTEAPIPKELVNSLREQKQLQPLGVQKTTKMLSYAQVLSTLLRSYPAEVRGNMLTIKMPYLNKAGCGKKN